jgi:hypothetical protein
MENVQLRTRSKLLILHYFINVGNSIKALYYLCIILEEYSPYFLEVYPREANFLLLQAVEFPCLGSLLSATSGLVAGQQPH